jgi:hypothetical protein
MDLADLPDDRVRKLVKDFRKSSGLIAGLLQTMLIAPVERRFIFFNRLQRELGRLRQTQRRWALENLPYYYLEASALTRRTLERANVPVPTSPQPIEAFALNALSLAFSSRIDAAIFSLGAVAGRILRSGGAVESLDAVTRAEYARKLNAGVSPEQARAAATAKFIDRLETNLLPVTTQTGRTLHYGLDYYVGLVAAAAMTQAKALPPRVLGPSAGFDLVRVSNNPSMHGDFCDAYTGKIFSLSGFHPVYPPIAQTPNGGPPYHPWCQHSLTLVMPWEDLTEDLPVSPLYLVEPGEDAHRIEQVWNRRHGKPRSRR